LIWIGAGIAALAVYGFVATLQDDNHIGRLLAYGAIFVAGSLAWGISPTGVPPRFLRRRGLPRGVAVIMYAPRSISSGRLLTFDSGRTFRVAG
jgi:small multidrug resistance family-3 protein